MACLLNAACTSDAGLDKGKFRKLDDAARGAKALIDSGASYQLVAGRVQELSVEISGLKDTPITSREKNLLQAYSELLAIYRDGLLLWKYKQEFVFLQPKLKGRIYVGQDVERIVLKYGFATQSHIYEPTG
ncbi:MAG TPA: hypothetical protein VMB78_00365, partial [Dissulfurispiraceae bacterium]|nr:hypothetical protein [Dissulfurispiraceae bacterium]